MTDGIVDGDRLLLDRYRLVAPIARGGMAEVWEGLDEVLTRPVAVKVLHRHLATDEGFRERFRREAIAAARLAHPNVVATFDTGEDGDLPFIVMELVRGRTLRAVLDDGPLSPAIAVALAAQVADALSAAHAAGLVHRDVKPGNILLCDGHAVGSAASVKVADFGIARAAASDGADATDLTQPGTLLGTTKYLAPEQVHGEEPDARSDVYALGVVLYEMVTGRAPFSADTPVATALAHVNAEPLRPRQLRPGIPRSLEQIILRAMAKDAAQRFQTADELAAALRALSLGDDAIPSVVRDPTPPRGQPASFQRSERSWIVPAAVISLTAVVLVALALVLGGAEGGRRLLERASGDGAAAAIPIAGVGVLDPKDGEEKNGRLPNVNDGDPSTSWATDRYETPDFGGLKDHLGLRLDLGESVEVRRVVVTSPTSGWNAELYLAEQPADDIARWGSPVARLDDVQGTATFEDFQSTGRYVLVLFTRLGPDRRVEVQEVTVAG